MSILKHFRTKKPDGTYRAGFGVWAFFYLGLVASVLYLTWGKISHSSTPVGGPTAAAVARKVQVEPIAEAAENIGTKSPGVANTRVQPTSDRGSGLQQSDAQSKAAPDEWGQFAGGDSSAQPNSAQPESSTVTALDTLNQGLSPATDRAGQGGQPRSGSSNLSGKGTDAGAAADHGEQSSDFGAPGTSGTEGDAHQRLDEGGAIAQVAASADELPPAYVKGSSGGGGAARPDIRTLVYQPPGEPGVAPAQAGASSASKSTVTEVFMPRGEKLEVFLLDTIDTGQLASYIEAGVAKTAYFNGKMVMPFGARLIGASSTTGVRDRIQISFTAVRFPDGLELPIRAIAKDPDDEATGVRAYFIPPPMLIQMAPYMDQFMNAFVAYETERFQTQNVQVGAIGIQLAPSAAAKEDAVNAAASAVNQFAADNLKELQARYASHLVLPKGCKLIVQLTSNFNAAPIYADNGSVKVVTTAEELPGRPNGVDPFPGQGVQGGDTVTAGQLPAGTERPNPTTVRQNAPSPDENASTSATAESAKPSTKTNEADSFFPGN